MTHQQETLALLIGCVYGAAMGFLLGLVTAVAMR